MRILFVYFFCFISLSQVKALPEQNQLQLTEIGMEEIKKQDSINHIRDSLQMLWIKSPLPNRPNQFIDSLKDVVTVKDGDILGWGIQFKQGVNALHVGVIKIHREQWIVFTLGLLILFYSILKFNYSSQLNVIIRAVYSNSAFAQLNKEDKIYNSWPFLLLYILFGFVIGMFIFFGTKSFHSHPFDHSLSSYIVISLGIILYFSLKIGIVKLLGFVFEVQPLSKEYNSIIFLSYFNGAIFLLPITVILAFLPQAQVDFWFVFFSFLLLVFILLQIARACYYTLMTYKLSKFYLILYFCTLEIGPLLIMLKAIGL